MNLDAKLSALPPPESPVGTLAAPLRPRGHAGGKVKKE